MKSAAPLLLLILPTAALGAVPAAVDLGDPASRFAAIGDAYKQAEVLTDSLFNPFKIKGAVGLPGGKGRDAAAVTDQGIADAVERRRVTGILLAPDPANNRVIIGDEIFSVGDALQFFDRDKGVDEPLALGATVVLKDVKQDSLAVEVSPDGENPRRLELTLRTFWRP